jgi:nicotinamidase/pyrazinamidase
MNKMLLIVDPQVDFITGTLPVKGAVEAMDALAEYVKSHGDDYSVKIVTSDWHPYHHCSFNREGGQWPPHCIQHSVGAAIWQPLLVALNESRGGYTLLYKGDSIDKEEYSIIDNEKSSAVLLRLIFALQIDKIDICGLAGDVCVRNTAKDLQTILGEGKVNVMEEFSPSIA